MVDSKSGPMRAVVYGAAGYVGGELLRLLVDHPEISEVVAVSKSQSGETWESVHPAMAHRPAARFRAPTDTDPKSGDLVFLALPHGRSQSEIGAVLERNPHMVIDLSADFRIPDAELFERYYGAHSTWDTVSTFRYGAADPLGESLFGARRIAAPGCFATAAFLGLHPFVRAEAMTGTPTCFALTGSTGAGTHPKRTTHHPVRAHNLFGYAPTGHRHEAEVTAFLEPRGGRFVRGFELLPHSAPIVRGIHATLRIPFDAGHGDVGALLEQAYADRPFVRVLDRPPEVTPVVGTNYAHLHGVDRGDGTAIVYVVIDNLVKGAAGQALQAMNLALGFEETAGLTASGLYPC